MTKLCAFCGRHYDMETMTPLFEQNRDHIDYCFPAVKSGEATLFPFVYVGRKRQP